MAIMKGFPVVSVSAHVATVLFGIVILIQLLIAAGVLPITMAWGGRQQVLTVGLRIAGVVSALVLAVFIYIVRRRAGLVGSGEVGTWILVLSWVVTAYIAFNTATNFLSQSAIEKMVFIPLTSLLTIACFIVSVSRR
jgi:hypothetical protein